MIKIVITDAHLEPPTNIIKTCQYLMSLIGGELLPKKEGPQGNPTVPDAIAVASYARSPVIETPVPAPVPTPEAATAPGVELDIDGFPWDRRIHSRLKSKTTDGKWRYQRGVGDEKIAEIEKQLKSGVANSKPVDAPKPAPVVAPVEPVEPPAPVKLPEPPAPVEQPEPATPVEQPEPAPVVEPVEVPKAPELVATPPPPPVPATEAPADFQTFMDKSSHAIISGKLEHADVIAIIQEFGMHSIPLVTSRPDLIPAIVARLDEVLRGK